MTKSRRANNLDRSREDKLLRASYASDMPETVITQSKRDPDLRTAAVTRTETRLPRCVQRRLPCVPLPVVKCHPRPSPYRCADHRVPKTPYRLAIGLRAINRTDRGDRTPIPNGRSDRYPSGGFFAIGTPRCKKSLSMMDLSLPAVDPDIGDLKSESGSTVSRLDEVVDRSKDISTNGGSGRSWTESERDEVANSTTVDPTVRAANVVCHMLVVNAWRRRRAEIAQLERQVEHLHLQIEFLRRLLLVENDRVGKLNGELHREKTQLEGMTRERDIVRSEKEKLEAELKRVEEISGERSVTVGNLRNELLTARDQLKALDAQMTKDREKLLKLREDKRILLDKVSASDALATERAARAERAGSAVEELQLRLAAQTALVESAQEQLQRTSRELQVTEAERQRLEKRLKATETNARILSLRATSLEDQLADRENAFRHIESEYNSQMTELRELKEQLLRRSQEVGWSSRMLQIAGSIMRASILRTFAFLSSAALSLPPYEA